MAEANSTVTYKDIPGFPGYRVGDDGSVWTCFAMKRVGSRRVQTDSWKLLGQYANPKRGNGRMYRYLNLHRDGKQKTFMVHSLVLNTFIGPRPNGYECRHLDGDVSNNRLQNLKWGTPQANADDRIKHGRVRKGEEKFNALLTTNKVRKIRQMRADNKLTIQAIAVHFGVSPAAIRSVLSGRTWKHVV